MKTLFNAILISFLLISCQTQQKKESKNLKFEIKEKKDISYLNNPRMVYRIVLDVDSLPSEKEMKNTAVYLWKDGNQKWKEFTVFIYLPEMDTRLSAYGVGEFNKTRLVKFNKNDNALFGTKWQLKNPVTSEKKISITKLKEYKIDIITNKIKNRNVEITINTNFPDGTKLLLSVGRKHFLKGVKDTYSGDIFSKDFFVKNGKIKTIVKIDDTKWYNEHLELVKALPNDIQPIAKISDKITISVLFTPAEKQKENVLKILGSKGEFVTGKGSEKFGNFTIFNASKDLKIPFKK